MANSAIPPHPRELESTPLPASVAGLKIHMVGICGTAMASLAGLLQSMGARVTGSDQNVYPPMSLVLENLSIDVKEGFSEQNIPLDSDWVVIGNVISRSNPEAQAVLKSQIPFCSLPQALGSIAIAHRHSIVVSGTHGKTTTTSMAAWIAEALGKRPGFMIGGIAKNFPHSFSQSSGDYFIIEGDEYDTAFFDKGPKFLHYRPRTVILNSIEFDHADIYRDLEHVKQSFIALLQKVPDGGLIAANAHEESIQDVIDRSGILNRPVRTVFFADASRALSKSLLTRSGRAPQSVYSFEKLRASQEGLSFSIERAEVTANGVKAKREQLAEIQMGLLGRYNAMNALAAFTTWSELGESHEKIAMALASFKGVKRRQEILGRPQGIAVIEDFAHHPTAVGATLKSLRSHFPSSVIHAVFEFRSATARRDIFTDDYLLAFQNADQCYFPPVFNQDSIAERERFHIDRFVSSLNSQKPGLATLFTNVEDIVSCLADRAKSGDVIVIMSNGGFDGIYQKLLNRLNDSSPQGKSNNGL